MLYPDSDFCFGEARWAGPCAVVSAHRLRQEFYGLPSDHELFRQRLIKEAVHEVGHTLNLTHCDDYRCVMASSHAVEWIDLKDSALCDNCHSLAVPRAVISRENKLWSDCHVLNRDRALGNMGARSDVTTALWGKSGGSGG